MCMFFFHVVFYCVTFFLLLYISTVCFFRLPHFLPWFFASFLFDFFLFVEVFFILNKVCVNNVYIFLIWFFRLVHVSHYLNLTFFLYGTQFLTAFFVYAPRDFWSTWILRISFSFTIQWIIHVSLDCPLTGFKMCFWIIYVRFFYFCYIVLSFNCTDANVVLSPFYFIGIQLSN